MDKCLSLCYAFKVSGVHKSSQVYHRHLDMALQYNMDDLWPAFTKTLHTVFAAGSRIDHACTWSYWP